MIKAGIKAPLNDPKREELAKSLTLTHAAVEKLITSRTKAISITHLYGKLSDVSGIRNATSRASAQRIWLIEDCAQAHGAERDGTRAGNFGDAGTFRFYPTKNLGAIGDAGALVTDDETLARQFRLLRQYGWESRYKSTLSGGRNSRM